jgi:oxalyl-CoA decarboxylase
VVDAAPKQIPAPDAVKRALDLLRSSKKPLIILGKGAAYAQADADIKTLIEKTGIPYLPMSMAKGLLPDTHVQSASAARSFVLAEADVVVLIGARLNWLLSHGKGKTWGGPKQFVQIDISPTEIDSNVAIAAPVIGDIGSCVSALLGGIDASFPKPSAEWINAIAERKNKNLAKMAATLEKNPSPMNFHSALRAIRDVLKTRPDINVVNEGANTLDYARSIIDMYEPRKRFDSGTWGIMGIGMGFAIGAAVTSGTQVVAIEGDSAFGFSGMELETICRYDLPVCTIIFNNNGVYRGTDVNPTGGKDVAPTVFVKGARYDKMIEAFGGIGYNVTTPEELTQALVESIKSGKPSLINAVIDEAAGTESGRLTNLNPQSGATKK